MSDIRDVAEKAGVSPTTVSHVINNTRFVSEEARAKVLAAMDELNYRPNVLARSLRRGETHTLGLILPDSGNPFFAEVGRGVETAAFEQGYNVILCNTESDIHREALYVEVLAQKQVDGVAFVAVSESSVSLQHLIDTMELPVVVVDRDLADVEVDAVLCDNLQGGYSATHHLIDLGHQRIGCITGPSNITPSAQRVTGYRAAIADAGIDVDEELIIRGDFHPISGQSGTHAMLDSHDPPTAIFACNDLMAIGVLRAAGERGLRVPDDLAVVGFDDIEIASYTNPPLTTVIQPKQEMGRKAAELLIEHILSNRTEPRKVVLSSRLVIRGSSGKHQ